MWQGGHIESATVRRDRGRDYMGVAQCEDKGTDTGDDGRETVAFETG